MTRPRIAAALLLTRGAGPGREVFLVERAAELKFFGGYHALPGGVLADGEDLQACALRELFEETGLLRHNLRGMAGSPQELRKVREKMVAKDAGETGLQAWRSLCAEARTPQPLQAICSITTPPFAPVRYDTLFLLHELPEGETPEIWPGELVGGRFWTPAAALAAWRRGELLIVPPVLILLELLGERGLDEFVAAAQATAARYDAGDLHRVQFTPGVVLASIRTPTLPPATTTNCLIVGTGQLVIVDPGAPDPDEQARLYRLLDELQSAGARLEAILLTHHHRDHVGAVHALSQRYELPVHAHALTLGRLAPGFRRGRALEDGARIPLGCAPDGSDGWHLQAIFTPGHDRGHLCYRESRYDAVLVGDMLSTISTIVIDPPEGHMATYLQSLDRLLQEPMGTLYPAHGPAMRDGHRLVDQYLRHRRQREAHLVRALAGGPRSLEALLPEVYWDVDAKMHGIAARSLRAGLEKLVEEGIAEHAEGFWQLGPRAPAEGA